MTDREKEYFERLRRARSSQEEAAVREAFAQAIMRDVEAAQAAAQQEEPATTHTNFLTNFPPVSTWWRSDAPPLTLESLKEAYRQCIQGDGVEPITWNMKYYPIEEITKEYQCAAGTGSENDTPIDDYAAEDIVDDLIWLSETPPDEE